MALAIPAVPAAMGLTEMFLATHSFSVSFETNGSPCSHEHLDGSGWSWTEMECGDVSYQYLFLAGTFSWKSLTY